MARVAVTDGMDENAVKIITDSGHEVVKMHYSSDELLNGALVNFDAVIVRSATKMTKEVIIASKKEKGKLTFIGRAGVGVDNIDIETATVNEITVCNTPRASTRSVVEMTLAHLLASCRNITTADRKLRQGIWAKKELLGSELSGKSLGLIGYGRIAQGVGIAARALGMEIHAYDPYVPEEVARKLDCTLHTDVNSIFRICTHISIHCNLTEETYHLANTSRINLMPGKGTDGIYCGNHLINCARGGIVDEEAALEGLKNGQLSSVALDVFEVEPAINNPLFLHDNFHGTPHIGAATKEAQARIGLEMASLIIEHFDGNKPATALN
jgi:D-3-phosphoglycerate dehydrogenase|tara:strand:+ start:4473 stop:5450 length:978 start_codon:yes stop_codon:yes gene_type:complete